MIIQISKHSNDPAVASPPTSDITAFRHEHLELNWIFKNFISWMSLISGGFPAFGLCWFSGEAHSGLCGWFFFIAFCICCLCTFWKHWRRLVYLAPLSCGFWGRDGFLSRWRQGLDEVTDPAIALVSVGLGCNAYTLTLPHLCVLMFLLLSPARAHDWRR